MAGSSYGYNFHFDPEKESQQRVSINQLHLAPMYSIVCGVVIGKSSPRFVATKGSGDRYVLNFTIRDSPSDTINAACWGDDGQVKNLSAIFSIGDVVKIKNPQIINRQADSTDGKYKPCVTSPHELNVSPKNSEISVCNDEESLAYKYFLHVPLHVPSNHMTLADVVYDGQNVEGMTVNLLVAVKKIGSVQNMKSKDGRFIKKLEMSVFDETHPSFPVLIWDESLAQFVQKYCAPKSILLISDIRLNFNRFLNGMMATATSTTIITPQPDISDARVLHQYAQTMVPDDAISDPSEKGNTDSQICTVNQLKQKLYITGLTALQDVQGFLFAYITRLDIDGTTKITSVRCTECKQLIRGSQKRCINGNCEIGAGGKVVPPEEVFDLMVSITDHTGTLPRCSLIGQTAQDLLNCSVQEFSSMSEAQKTSIKWQSLLEKFKIEYKVPYTTVLMGNPIIRITSCVKCDPGEVAQYFNILF